MTFFDLDLDNLPETGNAAEGEYLVRCTAAEEKESKATEGNRYIELTLDIEGVANVWPVRDRMNLPGPGDSEEKATTKKQFIKRTCDAFGVGYKFSPEDFVGRTAYAYLIVEDNDPRYPAKNVVKRYVTRANG